MEIRNFAGIDIGTNGGRLFIADIIEENGKRVYLKNTMTRVPIRLGTDVFGIGKISDETRDKLCSIIMGYRHIMISQKVQRYRACATSAMREASNGQEVSDYIFDKTGIRIEIITGDEEAEIIASVGLNSFLKDYKDYVGIDVGGGSTELTIYKKGKKIVSRSFGIGGVRLLNGDSKEVFDQMEKWVDDNDKGLDDVITIGSGGNINKVSKELGAKKGNSVSLNFLEDYYKEIKEYSVEERMSKFELPMYRADVIVKALPIYIKVMKIVNSKEIIIPKIGLVDGIVRGDKGFDFKI